MSSGPGSRRESLSTALTTAYGDGLLSDSTFAHRMEALLRSGLVEPERLVGDLSVRVPRTVALHRLRQAPGRWRRALITRRATGDGPPPLLALDWTGRTEELVIGRHPGCDIVLVHPTVSRRHARLHFRDGRWVLHDLDSTNGTSVNHTRVVRCQLAPGDLVLVGGQALVVD